MTTDSFDWDDELPPETEEEVYRALLRALRRKQGFGLFFVQCTPAQGKKIVANLRRDLAQQRIEEMHLEGEVLTLYDRLTALWKDQPFDVLIVEGLQHSLYAYEDTKRFSGWSSSEIYNYSWKGVPQILNHLNQQRERLRDEFPARFVFLVPPFVVDYFIQRAADFLDWRSGLFRFPRDPQDIFKEVSFLFKTYKSNPYFDLTSQERVAKILALKAILQDLDELSQQEVLFQQSSFDAKHRNHLESLLLSLKEFAQKFGRSLMNLSTPTLKLHIIHHIGHLFALERDYKNVINSFDNALEIKLDNYLSWACRGIAFLQLGRFHEAAFSFDKALNLKPDDHASWRNQGIALMALDRFDDALISFEKALKLKPDDYTAWGGRGFSLKGLGRLNDAIINYNKALQLKPDDEPAGVGKWSSLYDLGHYEDAISSLNIFLKFKPDFHLAWYNKACCHSLQAQADLAIASLQKAIALDTKYKEMARTDSDFDAIREDERFQALLRE